MTTNLRRRRLRAVAALAVAIAGAGSCAAVAASASSAPATRQASLPHLATYDSLHWVGYTFPVRHVTGVRAAWTEPRVHGKKGTEEFVWLGIGGWNQADNNIIQVGTFAYFPPSGGLNEGVWYERVPINPEALFPLVGVGPGDHIEASITLQPGRGSKWRISLKDTTIGTSFGITLRFKSLETFPSFVVEDPNKGAASPKGPFYPFPVWKSVTFFRIEVRLRNTWTPVARLPRYRVNMVRGRHVLATAGSLTRQSGFTARQR